MVRGDETGQEHGFTLIEIMVVCVIIGFATTLAVPNFLAWQARNQLRYVTSEVATQLMLARMTAMNRNREVNVTLQNIGGSVVKISGVNASDSSSFLNQDVQSKGALVNGSPKTVSFSSLGLRTSGDLTKPQTIGICNAEKLQYSVTIIPGGKVNWATTIVSTEPSCP